ncbi:SurA N-terminal domain-containing protein [Actinacidiphila glaucinigra]|uniref:SurA N-terminal domain-containing protein n=1 Tax=Actinacidiphila glaucinigra TaxID=235986 RepID=A0A239ARC7_9ACTN|nr:SurA N-terminal domain-containing protein [Actinacidiphila glaucinigra]SNR97614.1 SurA N-terminal domain-containing protein [Actinacidiphila glaucinigra]
MLRRRTALSVTAAAAVLLAAPLLTSCGTPHAGAAAVVGGEQITVEAVQAKVAAVRDAQEKTPQAAQLIEASSDLQRNVVHRLVQNEVIERAAEDIGVSVSRRELQKARTDSEQQAGGKEALEAQLLQTYAMVPADIDESIRTDLLMQKVATHYGADVQTPEGQTALIKVLRDTSKSLRIDVNPRYGKWNSDKLDLDATKDPWLSEVSRRSAQA